VKSTALFSRELFEGGYAKQYVHNNEYFSLFLTSCDLAVENTSADTFQQKHQQKTMDISSAQKILKGDQYATLTGVEVLEAGKGYCKARLIITKKHLNAAGVVQGGAIFTLADLAFAIASNSHGPLALAINVNISFLAGKSEGVLYAAATEVAQPKRLGAYDVLVTDEEHEIIARFNGMVYRKKQQLQ
jgi:acyl-CoA thioesterase